MTYTAIGHDVTGYCEVADCVEVFVEGAWEVGFVVSLPVPADAHGEMEVWTEYGTWMMERGKTENVRWLA